MLNSFIRTIDSKVKR